VLIPIAEALLLDSPDALEQQIDLRRAALAANKSFVAFPAAEVGEVVRLKLALRRLKAPPAAPEPTRRAEPEPERGVAPAGPWSHRLWSHRDRWQEASIRAASLDGRPGNNIATVSLGGADGTSRSDLDIEATARLIAAAPVMLETLRWLRSCDEGLHEFAERKIDKAIEAATGEKP